MQNQFFSKMSIRVEKTLLRWASGITNCGLASNLSMGAPEIFAWILQPSLCMHSDTEAVLTKDLRSISARLGQSSHWSPKEPNFFFKNEHQGWKTLLKWASGMINDGVPPFPWLGTPENFAWMAPPSLCMLSDTVAVPTKISVVISTEIKPKSHFLPQISKFFGNEHQGWSIW